MNRIKRWLFRRILNKQERIMINDIVGHAYFSHKKGQKEGRPKWTVEGERMVLEIEKLVMK